MPKRRRRWRIGRLDLRCLAVLGFFRLRLAFRKQPIRPVPPAIQRPREQRSESIHYARQVATSVRHAARFVPGARCLAQALAVQYLLARSGHRADIMVGVAPADDAAVGPFRAHAWIECDGMVVVSGDEGDPFTPLLRIG